MAGKFAQRIDDVILQAESRIHRQGADTRAVPIARNADGLVDDPKIRQRRVLHDKELIYALDLRSRELDNFCHWAFVFSKTYPCSFFAPQLRSSAGQDEP